MKRLLQLGLILGFGGTLAAAYFVPWVSYARFVSEASVIANGGRSERFLIRLPADLIPTAGAVARLQQEVPDAGAGVEPIVEHFKVRDVKGNVLGIAARHWNAVAGSPTAAWVVAIPSRGTLVASGAAEEPGALSTALRGLGWQPGQPFNGAASLELISSARSVATTGEFAGIEFELAETLSITGIDGSGAIQGTISLDTIGRRTL